MKDLETYNRVPSLESPLTKNLVFAICVLLLLIALAGLTAPLLTVLSWVAGLGIFISCMALYAMVVKTNAVRMVKCQYCGGPLSYVIRPMLLTADLLASKGVKQGDFFYTLCQWGRIPFKKRWAKISNRSLACHHCRLSEEKQRRFYEQPDSTEMGKIHTSITQH